MRLLPVRANHERRGTAKRQAKAYRRGYRPSDVRQHLSLRNLPTHPARYSSRRGNFRGGRALAREGGAMARIMLTEAAATKWTVPPESCHVAKGFVIHAESNKKASYGSLTEAASQLKPPPNIPLKDPKKFTLIGKATRRLDTPSKI